MAERPGELKETPIIVENTATETAVADDSENAYLRDQSQVGRSNSVEFSGDNQVKKDETSGDTEKIRANIEETRSEMSETIDAIQEKLSFSKISEQVKDEVSEYVSETIQTAKDSVYGATIGKVGDVMNYVEQGINDVADTTVVRTARQNPLALALIGLGAGLLLINGYQNKRPKYRYENDDFDRDYRGYRGRYSARDDDDDRNYGRGFSSADNQSTFDAAKSKVSGAAGAVSDSVSSAAGAVSDSVSGVAGAVSETVSDVAGKTYKKVGAQASDFAESAQDQYDYYMEENPLAVGAVALALGAAVGMAIPSTRVENRFMGEARENLVQKAENTARETVGKVQQVAGQVTETVKDEAKKQGLT